MQDSKKILEIAARTIQMQSVAIADLLPLLSESFFEAVNTIINAKGRLIVSGIGKSAIVAQKIVATMNSTGTPALFMHAADAIHGDLGMVQKDDVVLVISKSGDSPEIKVLVPLVKGFGNTIIGMIGNDQSFLATHSNIMLNATVAQEACPNNLAPTTSTTAQMVLGDALAICLMEAKEFGTGDFAKYHPGGALGKKLYLRAGEMVLPEENPMVMPGTPVREVLVEITSKRLGAAAVINADEIIQGIITDGDIRRMLEKYENINDLKAEDIMGLNPKTIEADSLAVDALQLMRENNINQLIVTMGGKYKGMLHLHDLLKEGII